MFKKWAMIAGIGFTGLFAGDYNEIPIDYTPDHIEQIKKHNGSPSLRHSDISFGGGLVLINDYTSLLGFNTRGQLALTIPADGGMISSFSFLPQHNRFVVTVRGNDGNYRTAFYDDKGGLKTVLEPSSFMPTDGFIRQIVESDGKIFANRWSGQAYTESTTLPLLQEIELNSATGKGKKTISEEKNPFHPALMESGNFIHDFKLHWIVAGNFAHDWFVVDEIQPRVWIYEDTNQGFQLKQNPIGLNLENRIPPLNRYDSSKEKPHEWLFSFSRTVGFTSYENGFLLCQVSPNKAHPWYSPTADSELATTESPFVLQLYYLGENLERAERDPITIPGGYFVGADSGRIYVMTGNVSGDQYHLGTIYPSHFSGQDSY